MRIERTRGAAIPSVSRVRGSSRAECTRQQRGIAGRRCRQPHHGSDIAQGGARRARHEPHVDTDKPLERGAPTNSRHGWPAVTLFSVPFKSRMTDEDIERLRSSLDLVIHITDKSGVSGASPGMVPLDSWSGLLPERGAGEDEWVLEARTWGSPPESAAANGMPVGDFVIEQHEIGEPHRPSP